MIKVNAITQLFMEYACKRERESDPNIYQVFAEGDERLDNIGVVEDADMVNLLERFAADTFGELLSTLASRIGILLIEVKNQKSAADAGISSPNIDKLNALCAEIAKDYEFLAHVLKAAGEDANFRHVAERAFEVGKTAYEARKNAS